MASEDKGHSTGAALFLRAWTIGSGMVQKCAV